MTIRSSSSQPPTHAFFHGWGNEYVLSLCFSVWFVIDKLIDFILLRQDRQPYFLQPLQNAWHKTFVNKLSHHDDGHVGTWNGLPVVLFPPNGASHCSALLVYCLLLCQCPCDAILSALTTWAREDLKHLPFSPKFALAQKMHSVFILVFGSFGLLRLFWNATEMSSPLQEQGWAKLWHFGCHSSFVQRAVSK